MRGDSGAVGTYRRHVSGNPTTPIAPSGQQQPGRLDRGRISGNPRSLGRPQASGPQATGSRGPSSAPTSAPPTANNRWKWKSKLAASELGAKLKRPQITRPGLRVSCMLMVALAVAFGLRNGVLNWSFMAWLAQQTGPELVLVAIFGLLCTYAVFLCQGIIEMLSAQSQRNLSFKWSGSLDEKKRKLLGISSSQASQEEASTQKPGNNAEKGSAPPALRATPPLGPPQRPQSFPFQLQTVQCSAARISSSPYTPLATSTAQGNLSSRTPVSPFSHPSPSGTPEPKLEDYLRHLDSEMTALSTPPGMDAYDPGNSMFRGYSHGSPSPLNSSNLFNTAYPHAMGVGAVGNSQPSLPLGAGAPKYRPSPLPRSTAGVPREDGRLTASHQDTVDAVLQRLNISHGALEIWTENLRQWMATSVLKPLVQAMDGAAAEVATATQAVGLEGIRFSELGMPEGAEERGSRHGLVGGQTEADEQLMITQLQEWIEAKGRTQQLTQPDIACYEAVNKYKHLLKLLSGQQPSQMLQAAPRGYIAFRVRQLADSSCMMGFDWKKGADYGGKPWSAELPTDSSLMFYLFAAYLEAPNWEWPIQPATAGLKGARAGPLYVSSLPSRPAEQYTAILPFRPNEVHKGAAAVLGLALASANPHFSLVLDGEVAVTLAGANAVLHVLLLLVQYVKLHRLSLFGEHHLDQRKLNLLWVIEDISSASSFVPKHWFGLW